VSLIRSTLALLGAAVALAACGGSEQEPEAAAPDEADSALIESAEITPEELEALGGLPSEESFIRSFVRECGDSNPCRCAAEALFLEVSAAEFTMTLFSGSEGERAIRKAFEQGVRTCAKGVTPPGRVDGASELVPDGPVEVTPASIDALIGRKFTHEQARDAFVRDCSQLATSESCECRYDELAEQLEVSEFVVLSLNLPEALDSSYFSNARDTCSES
jgi:hypothetical protein